jgi:periplasmic protein TonB
MFDELVSSRIKRKVAPARGLMVAAMHGVVIAGAIRATATPLPAPPPPRIDTTIFIVEHPDRHPDLPNAPPTPGGAEVLAPPIDLPPPPLDVPTTIPPVAPGPPLDPALIRRALSVGVPGPAGRDSSRIGAVLAVAEVDQPAEAITQPKPRYPPVLQHAGIEGRVVVEFIIDTVGHVEPGSLRMLESSNPGFEPAAAETLRRSVFRPARAQGRPVRQRTVQAVAFRITAP